MLNLGLGFHAPDLEVVVAAKTPVASIPLAVKNIWFEVRTMLGGIGTVCMSWSLSCRCEWIHSDTTPALPIPLFSPPNPIYHPSQGMLRVEIELVPDFPHAKTVLITFLEKPIVDFR